MVTTTQEETSYEQPSQRDMEFLSRIKPNAGNARTEENEREGQADARRAQEDRPAERGETAREAKQLKSNQVEFEKMNGADYFF